MRRVLAGLALAALGLALSAGPAGAGTEQVLKIVKTTLTSTGVIVMVENTSDALVDGRCLGKFDNGNGEQSDQKNFVHIEPGYHEIEIDFPPGPISPTGVRDEPVPITTSTITGMIILGTITDDITPF